MIFWLMSLVWHLILLIFGLSILRHLWRTFPEVRVICFVLATLAAIAIAALVGMVF